MFYWVLWLPISSCIQRRGNVVTMTTMMSLRRSSTVRRTTSLRSTHQLISPHPRLVVSPHLHLVVSPHLRLVAPPHPHHPVAPPHLRPVVSKHLHMMVSLHLLPLVLGKLSSSVNVEWQLNYRCSSCCLLPWILEKLFSFSDLTFMDALYCDWFT